ncbi:Phox-like protein [Xylariaceae sp. FL1019]|nr:Phox-like protein [Xylariaceae sp. FL1019]
MAPPAEITIPTTSLHTPTDNSKPYTLYNITLRLPLRTFVVQKRYSDFASLHQTLTNLVSAAPPAPLPAKSWFKSTLKSPDLLEDRRRGLESYLRAIAESPDRRWRDTPAWRTFLNLPAASSTGNSAASVAGGYGIPNKDAANAAAAEDPGTWLDLHSEMKRDFQEARRCLAKRDAASESNPAIHSASAAKKALVKAGGILSTLKVGLQAMEDAKRLGEGEIRRRKDLLAAARVDREDLETLTSTMTSTTRPPQASAAASRAAPQRTEPSKGRRVLGAPLPETERTRELDNNGAVQLQVQMMKEQDEDVNALGKIIRRQREMAEAITREVDEQNEILDDVNDRTDLLQGKVDIAKKRVKKIS